ncbi:hypothetical protein PAXRUDRAFT_28818 [Paxillus rubicundulus Ve08.2h10]|uniref:Uncharacterized protein n=1 Tax=Paxillus rubicundulus Ve08.2h10 TaxID=930991 RepID=A0A0D0C2G7_9AGAM|nr:hypothetical protein PAXRUDRAFT_28818 [Paxillus rubicundulus Ve08.2h10]
MNAATAIALIAPLLSTTNIILLESKPTVAGDDDTGTLPLATFAIIIGVVSIVVLLVCYNLYWMYLPNYSSFVLTICTKLCPPRCGLHLPNGREPQDSLECDLFYCVNLANIELQSVVRPVSMKTMSTMELQMPASPMPGHEDLLPFPMGFNHDGGANSGPYLPVQSMSFLRNCTHSVKIMMPGNGVWRSHKGPWAQCPPDNLKSKKVHVKRSIQHHALLLGNSGTGDAVPPPAVERSKDTQTQAEKVAINPWNVAL